MSVISLGQHSIECIIIVAVSVAIQLRRKLGHQHEGTDSTALLRKYKKELRGAKESQRSEELLAAARQLTPSAFREGRRHRVSMDSSERTQGRGNPRSTRGTRSRTPSPRGQRVPTVS
uniref:V3 protein n=1 Tax=Haemonchus contortus TaxID=6289 RepID=A0A7I4YXX9_HAECO